MIDKIKNLVQKGTEFVRKYELTDVRTIGLIIFAFMAITVTWSGAKAIQLNYQLQKKVVVLQEQNKVQSLQNDTQALKNEYYKTDEYKELAARRLFGKAAPGEKIYVIPKDVAYRYAGAMPTQAVITQTASQNPVKLPSYEQHVQDWLDFFFHRRQL